MNTVMGLCNTDRPAAPRSRIDELIGPEVAPREEGLFQFH